MKKEKNNILTYPAGVILLVGCLLSFFSYQFFANDEKAHTNQVHEELTASQAFQRTSPDTSSNQGLSSNNNISENGLASGRVMGDENTQISGNYQINNMNRLAVFVSFLVFILTIMIVFILYASKKNYQNKCKLEDRMQSLAENQEHLQAMVDNMIDGLITINENGFIQSFNHAAERMFGYQSEEVLGCNINILMPEPYKHEHDTYLDNYLNSGKKKIIGSGREVEGLRKNGEIFPLDIAISEIRSDKATLFVGITRDITDRKLDLIELDRFKYALDNTVDMIFMFEADSLKFNYLNRGAIESMGYTEQELLQMTPFEIKPSMPESEFRQFIRPLEDGSQDALSFQTIHRRKNGEDFPVEIFLQLIKEPNNKGRFIAIVHDITERKQAEKVARRYSQALEKMHDITSKSNTNFDDKVNALLQCGCVYFDLPIALISHVDDDRFTIKYIIGAEGLPRAGSELVLADTYCYMTYSSNVPVAYHHVGKSELRENACYQKFKLEAYIGTPLFINGSRFGTLSFSGPTALDRPFNDAELTLIRMFSQWIGNELERMNIEVALHDNATRLGTILDTVVDAIISFDDKGCIESLNSAGTRLFGYRIEEIQGESFLLLLERGEQNSRLLNSLIHTNGSQLGKRIEVFAMRKNGTLFPIELAVNKMVLAGETHFTAVICDITERKKVDRIKNEFVSTVSHELRTPLTSIRGALSMMMGQSTEAFSDKIQNLLEMANRNSLRLTHLINDILDIEKIDAGQLDFELKCVDLSVLIRNTLDENESFAHIHNVRVEFFDHCSDAALVNVDEYRLQQVMANLLSNAVKYSTEDSTVEVHLNVQHSGYKVSVKDKGAGIPPAFRARIFDRFAQGDSSDSREKGGTGLGLAITKAIIERLGGTIDYVSKAGEGTTFFFDLPSWQPITLATQRKTYIANILICEDNTDVANIIANLLDEDGYVSDISATITSTRSLLIKNNYDLLLLDLKLPDGNGLQLLQELRYAEPKNDIPIIVISSAADQYKHSAGTEGLANVDWIQKPIDRSRFSELIRAVVDKQVKPKVLHIEPDLDVVQVTRTLLEDIVEIDFASTLDNAIEQIRLKDYDLLILDNCLSGESGIDSLDQIQVQCPVVVFAKDLVNLKPDQRIAATLVKSSDGYDNLFRTVTNLLITLDAYPKPSSIKEFT